MVLNIFAGKSAVLITNDFYSSERSLTKTSLTPLEKRRQAASSFSPERGASLGSGGFSGSGGGVFVAVLLCSCAAPLLPCCGKQIGRLIACPAFKRPTV